jgi:IS30 family transposase
MGARRLRVDEREFWRAIREGMSTEEAGRRVGLSDRHARRWFTQAGGMSPVDLHEPSSSHEAGERPRHLTHEEREEIMLGVASNESIRSIAERLNRAPSTISREVRASTGRALVGHYWTNRSSPPTGRRPQGPPVYRAVSAQRRAEEMRRRPKPTKLAGHERLRAYVQDKLSCDERWSPEQISNRLPLDFPDDESMRISHEAIYQSLFIQGRGGLNRELTTCLRTGRALRTPRRRAEKRGKRAIPPEILISERPASVEDRAVPGHWEGDLIVGPASTSAIGTLVERTTRYTMLLHLPGDHTAETVRDAIADTIVTLPEHLRLSLTWDQGTELAQHAQLRIDTDLEIYFCDPHSPWQRGTNENTNGLLRQYFPKGTDLSVHSAEHLSSIAAALNRRPRKTLNWRTPAEVGFPS